MGNISLYIAITNHVTICLYILWNLVKFTDRLTVRITILFIFLYKSYVCSEIFDKHSYCYTHVTKVKFYLIRVFEIDGVNDFVVGLQDILSQPNDSKILTFSVLYIFTCIYFPSVVIIFCLYFAYKTLLRYRTWCNNSKKHLKFIYFCFFLFFYPTFFFFFLFVNSTLLICVRVFLYIR